jgi:hypothetical protein
LPERLRDGLQQHDLIDLSRAIGHRFVRLPRVHGLDRTRVEISLEPWRVAVEKRQKDDPNGSGVGVAGDHDPR